MNCFEFRRLIFASPREKTREQEQHMAQCAACAALAREVDGFDARIYDAVRVPVPEGLAERVLLRHKVREPVRLRAWALAATFVLAIGVASYVAVFFDRSEPVLTAERLDPDHPAVAAISYVLDHEPRLLAENPSADPAVMRSALSRVGLSLPGNIGTIRYLGKCPVPGGTGEHVALETPFGHVTLILVPDKLFASRVVVRDRQLTALAAATRTGSYIVIAGTAQVAKQFEALLL